MELGNNIRRLRKQAGMTQEELAELLHVTGQAVSRWECGDGFPEITLLPALAARFDVTVDELLLSERLSDEELRELSEKADALEREGRTEQALALLRKTVQKYPHDEQLGMLLATRELLEARRNRGSAGRRGAALLAAEQELEKLSESGSDELRCMAENMLTEVYYSLGEKEKLLALLNKPKPDHRAYLISCADGKDFLYLAQKAINDCLIELSDLIQTLARREEEAADPLLCSPEGAARESWPDDAEKYDMLRRLDLILGLAAGDERVSQLNWIRQRTAVQMLETAARLRDADKVAETLSGMFARLLTEENVKRESLGSRAAERFSRARARAEKDGEAEPAAAALGTMDERDRQALAEPIAASPMLSFLNQVSMTWLRGSDMMAEHIEELKSMLLGPKLDFMRERAELRAALKRLDKLLETAAECGR
ncbi:MAG: helix-turn-helix domain-containing protein [Oscillospiraceae bacterium]|nr:helix-turn-helix domain-containing protein [Oscillospiraceae bacterium]